MTDFKAEGSIDVLIHDFDHAITKRGAHARVTVRVPGKWGRKSTEALYPDGPRGQIVAQTNDGNNLFVVFMAAQVKTKLEELKNDNATNANRN